MNNKHLIRQYINTGAILTAHQIETLSPNLLKSYYRRRIQEAGHGTIYSFKDYEIDLAPKEYRFDTIKITYKYTGRISEEVFTSLTPEQRDDIISMKGSLLGKIVVNLLSDHQFNEYIDNQFSRDIASISRLDSKILQRMNLNQFAIYLDQIQDFYNEYEYNLEEIYDQLSQDKFILVLKEKVRNNHLLTDSDIEKATDEFRKWYYDQACGVYGLIGPRDYPYMNERQIEMYVNICIRTTKNGYGKVDLSPEEFKFIPLEKLKEFIQARLERCLSSEGIHHLKVHEFKMLEEPERTQYIEHEAKTEYGLDLGVIKYLTDREAVDYIKGRINNGLGVYYLTFELRPETMELLNTELNQNKNP